MWQSIFHTAQCWGFPSPCLAFWEGTGKGYIRRHLVVQRAWHATALFRVHWENSRKVIYSSLPFGCCVLGLCHSALPLLRKGDTGRTLPFFVQWDLAPLSSMIVVARAGEPQFCVCSDQCFLAFLPLLVPPDWWIEKHHVLNNCIHKNRIYIFFCVPMYGWIFTSSLLQRILMQEAF